MSGQRGVDTAELVEGFLDSRRRQRLSPRSVAWYGRVLRRFAARYPRDPTALDVADWVSEPPSQESARTYLRALRALFAWGARSGLGPPLPPTAGVASPRRGRGLPRVLTAGELRRVLQAADRAGPLELAAVTVLLDTGIRIGELASARTERIEADALTVSGKTGDRRVPLSPESHRALMRITLPTGPVFRSSHEPHGALSVGRLADRVRACLVGAGLTGRRLGPHTLRHTFATLYLREGGDIWRLNRLLGHASLQQTMVYLHLSDAEAFAEHARLSPLRLVSGPEQLTLIEEASS